MHREMISPVEQMRAKYKKRRKEAGTREDSTMAKLAAFTSTIRTTKKRVGKEDKAEKKVSYDMDMLSLLALVFTSQAA